MSKVEIGNIKQQQKNMRGWLVGQFIRNSQFQDNNIEIYYKNFAVGDKSDKLHLHPKGKEYMVVISGKAKYRFGNEEILLEEGDYIAVPSNIPEKLVEVIEELTVFGVRYPSIPDNKVMLE